MAGAARELDARRAQESQASVLAGLGIVEADALHVAEQRALRAYAALTGQTRGGVVLDAVRVPPADARLLAVLQATWLDAFAAGVVAERRVQAREGA